MKIRPSLIITLLVSWGLLPIGLQAEALPRRIVHQAVILKSPLQFSKARLMKIAVRYEKSQDYVSAVLLYEAILIRRPSDRRVLKRMIQCHETMLMRELM